MMHVPRDTHVTKQRMAMRSNFPWSDFKKVGTPELSSSSSTSTALSPENFEKRAHPNQLDTINITIDEDYTFTIKEQKVRIKKYLGLVLDHKLKFDEHIAYIKKKVAKRIGAMYKSNKNCARLPLFAGAIFPSPGLEVEKDIQNRENVINDF